MKNQTDLLPWILGGLSVAVVAVVITVASAGKPVAPSPPGAATAQVASARDSLSSPAPATAATVATGAPVATVAAAPAVMPASVPDSDTAPPQATQAQATAEPAVQSGQIWQCMTNGVKTFSNNPCGEKSSLLELRAINTMNPTPVVRYARTTVAEPRYSPGYADENTDSDQEVYGEQAAETPVNSYAVVQGIAFLPRRRPDHPHHRPPFHHNPGDNPGHPGRNPGSPPRRN